MKKKPSTPAAANGYLELTFDSALSSDTVDVGQTYASGFDWYVGNFFNPAPLNPITFNGRGIATINGSAGNSNLQISTAGLKVMGTPASGWVGTAFGGGAYFEASLRFDPALVDVNNGWPAWWSMSIEHLASLPERQWIGQVPDYWHFSEVDFFEYDMPQTVPNVFGGTVNEYWGVYNTPSWTENIFPSYMRKLPANARLSDFHRYGCLWVPAKGSSTSKLSWYFDGRKVGTDVAWSHLPDAPPPPVDPWKFSILDKQHLVLILGSGANQPMTVESVKVWQASPDENLVQ